MCTFTVLRSRSWLNDPQSGAFTVLSLGSWLVNDPQSGAAISYEQPAIKPYSIGIKEMIETRNNTSCDYKNTETYEADILIYTDMKLASEFRE